MSSGASDLLESFERHDYAAIISHLVGNEELDVNSGSNTLLHHACGSGHVSLVTLLLAHPGIDVNRVDDSGCTPFLVACWGGQVEVIKLLLRDPRVDVNLPSAEGATPLWYAAYIGFQDVVRWLIASGRELDFDSKASDGTSALEAARKAGKSRIAELIKLARQNPKQVQLEMLSKLGLKGLPPPSHPLQPPRASKTKRDDTGL